MQYTGKAQKTAKAIAKQLRRITKNAVKEEYLPELKALQERSIRPNVSFFPVREPESNKCNLGAIFRNLDVAAFGLDGNDNIAP